MKTLLLASVAAAATLALGVWLAGCSEAKETKMNQSEFKQMADTPEYQTATFGAGCFWHVEHEFRQVEGVVATAVGFSGGTVEDPGYKQVCTGTTGHAEVVEVVFDPKRVSYEKLLDTFWACHDPTTLNRQGPDVGSQYRSVIFYHSPEQKAAAEASKEKQQAVRDKKVVTFIEPFDAFYRAEEYHQQYFAKHGQVGCAASVMN